MSQPNDRVKVGTETAGRLGLNFDDPLSELPEVARNLLLAAKRIVAEQGFRSLSLNSVSEASGENKAMVSYYFGGKAGLISAVLDSVIHDDYLASVDRMKDVSREERAARLVEEVRRICSAETEFLVFFELLPVALRDPRLRERLARLYDWYRQEKLEWLGLGGGSYDPADPGIVGLAQLLSAFIDGIAVQAAIEPDLDLAPAFAVLRSMIESRFPEISTPGAGGPVAEPGDD